MSEHRKLSGDKADRRMQKQTDRPDFLSFILKHNETEKGMSLAEIKEGAAVFILAGSETVSLPNSIRWGSILMHSVLLDGFATHRPYLSITSKSIRPCKTDYRNSKCLQDPRRNDTSQISGDGIPARLFGGRFKDVSSGTRYALLTYMTHPFSSSFWASLAVPDSWFPAIITILACCISLSRSR